MTQNKEYKEYVDIAKGTGIVFVLLSHTELLVGPLVYLAPGFFMPLFYFLSGMNYNKPENNELWYIKHKLSKQFFNYIKYTIILLFVEIIVESILGDGYSFRLFTVRIIGIFYGRYQVGDDILMSPYNQAMWFLPSLICCLSLFYICNSFVSKASCRKGVIIISVIASIVFVLITEVLRRINILLPWSLDTSFCLTLFIACGYAFKNLNVVNEERTKENLLICLSLVIIYTILARLNGYSNISIGKYGKNVLLYIVTGMIGSMACIYFSVLLQKRKLGKFLALIGRHSIVFFAFHMTVYQIVGYVIHENYIQYLKFFVALVGIWLFCFFNEILKKQQEKIYT